LSHNERNGRIAFVRGADIYTTNPDGTQLRQLTKLPPGSFAEIPSWEPDDSRIVYTIRSSDMPNQLWIMNANGRNQHRLLDDYYSNTAGSYSPDGRYIVFSRCKEPSLGACAIYQVEIDGGSPSAVTQFQPGVIDSSPVFSPDGRTIAFERVAADKKAAVYLMAADGSNLRLLTKPGMEGRHPSWSPDGSQIALSCECGASGTAAIWIVDIGGTGRTLLSVAHADDRKAPVADQLFPSWSPDGNFLAVEERCPGTNSSVVVMDLAGSRLNLSIEGSQPSWSQAP
jgi:TolB protein